MLGLLREILNLILVQIKVALQIEATSPPLPVYRGVLKTVKLLGTAFPRTNITSAFNHVSVINKKSKLRVLLN